MFLKLKFISSLNFYYEEKNEYENKSHKILESL
jgi:hypothetical protein